MVPKIIHYCWFGRGEKPKIFIKCLKSWKKYCPDYKIIEWNEDNFDVNSTLWTKQAYEEKKWAFVSDYVRLWALTKYGGVYLDTDQELIKSLESNIEYDGFLGFMFLPEQSTECLLSAGVIGVSSLGDSHSFTKELLDYYKNRQFVVDGELDLLPNTDIITELFVKRGLKRNNERQNIMGFEIFPSEYFCPTSCITSKKCINKNTVSVHHFAASWRTEQGRKNMKKVKRHSTKIYKIYEQVAAYPIAIYKKVFNK